MKVKNSLEIIVILIKDSFVSNRENKILTYKRRDRKCIDQQLFVSAFNFFTNKIVYHMNNARSTQTFKKAFGVTATRDSVSHAYACHIVKVDKIVAE